MARTHTHVFRPSRSFDNDGLLAFDPDRYSVPSSICFLPDDPPPEPPAPPPASLTQEQVNAIIARERKATEDKIAKAKDAEYASLRAELDALKQQQEEAGKSAAEKAALALEREKNAWAQKTEAEKARAEAALAEAQKASAELRDTRLNYELNAVFAAQKVMPEATRAALLVFRADAEIEHDPQTGKVVAVTVAEKRFGTLTEAVDEWMKTNGEIYRAAPQGGAGTRAGNGVTSSLPHIKKTTEQLIEEGNALRAARR